MGKNLWKTKKQQEKLSLTFGKAFHHCVPILVTGSLFEDQQVLHKNTRVAPVSSCFIDAFHICPFSPVEIVVSNAFYKNGPGKSLIEYINDKFTIRSSSFRPLISKHIWCIAEFS